MRLEYFHYLQILADCGSISTAADRLLMTQPYLSSTLSRIEKELGITIFTRTNRGIVPTLEGQKLLKLIGELDQVLLQMHSLKYETCDYQYQICSFSAMFISSIAASYDRIRLRPMLSNQAVDQMVKRQCDMALVFASSMNLDDFRKAMAKKGLDFQILYTEPVMVLLGSRNPLYAKDDLTLNNLIPYSCSCEQIGLRGAKSLMSLVNPGSTAKPHVFSDLRSLYNHLILSNEYALGSQTFSMDNTLVEKGILKLLPLRDVDECTHFGCLLPKDSQPPQDVVEFIRQLRLYHSNHLEIGGREGGRT